MQHFYLKNLERVGGCCQSRLKLCFIWAEMVTLCPLHLKYINFHCSLKKNAKRNFIYREKMIMTTTPPCLGNPLFQRVLRRGQDWSETFQTFQTFKHSVHATREPGNPISSNMKRNIFQKHSQNSIRQREIHLMMTSFWTIYLKRS